MKTMTGKEILDLVMQDNDAGAGTVREYLLALLRGAWEEGEGFSGKRPFGNSSWEYDLYYVLVRNELMAGTFDEDGYANTDFDTDAGHALILSAIEALS